MSNILIIKHGSLGDIAQASGAIQDIYDNHKDDFIYLLTSHVYSDLFKKNPNIKEVIIDKRLSRFNLIYLFSLMKKIKMFKTSLERDLNQEVEWASEHLTSEDAKEKLKLQRQEGILSRKIMKGQIDSMAATIFLQDWMNQR